jgi:hypothetical protein
MNNSDEDWKGLFDEVAEELKVHERPAIHSEVNQIAPIASYIDHTLLSLDATPGQIDKLCDEAKEYSFAVIHAQ